MKIGIDLRALQTGHKYRGIGEVAKQVTNRILDIVSVSASENTSFVFFEYDDDDPKELLTIPENVRFEVVKLGIMPENTEGATKAQKTERNLKELYGHPINLSRSVDVFLQYDYNFGVPKNTKTVLVKHDLIPVIFRDQFFESPWIHFRHKAARTMLRTIFANYKFDRVLKRSVRNAKRVVTVSESTKRDLVRLLKVKSGKITTVHLGVSTKEAKTGLVKKSDLPTKPYLLFVGAGDTRRRVDDLVAAYNNLKAKGIDIQLVLVGENFPSPKAIPNQVVRNAILDSSYKSDILTLGYVDDATKQKLFRDAIAFVYPTLYEGFGIPILEAMLFKCPVITYKNSSIPEVAGKYALYAHDWQDIVSNTQQLIAMSETKKSKLVNDAYVHASEFEWEKTALGIFEVIQSLV